MGKPTTPNLNPKPTMNRGDSMGREGGGSVNALLSFPDIYFKAHDAVGQNRNSNDWLQVKQNLSVKGSDQVGYHTLGMDLS